MNGWKLVPVEPTAGMLAAGVAAESNAPTHVQERLTLYAYRAMLAAAPTPPAGAVTGAMVAVARAALAADARRLDAIRKSLHWDGHGYWLPDWCIKERERLEEAVPEPTLDEFRATIDALASREG